MAKKDTSFKPRRVRDEDDRQTGSSGYIQLDEGERFLGIALFEGNPAEDEPGYYEYYEHWNNAAKRSVPCAGDDCPFCEDGEKPKVRAKSLWFVLKDNKGNEVNELRTFNLNSFLIKQFTELRHEDEKILGRTFRIARLDDRGNYSVMPKTDVAKKADVKAYLKDAPNYDQDVTNQLIKAMEGVAVARAMDDDDDDEDEAPKGAKGGKGAKSNGKKPPKDEEPDDEDEEVEWPEEAEDITVTVAKVGTKADPNTLEVTGEGYDGKTVVWGTGDIDVTELDKGDDIVIDYETDGDGDKVLSSMAAAEAEDEPEDEDAKTDLPDAIEDVILEVVSVNAEESTIEVKNDELEFTLYFLDTMDVDFDDYKEGIKIDVDAEKDTAGDLVATKVPVIQKKAGGKKSEGGKGAKGGKAAAGKGGKGGKNKK